MPALPESQGDSRQALPRWPQLPPQHTAWLESDQPWLQHSPAMVVTWPTWTRPTPAATALRRSVWAQRAAGVSATPLPGWAAPHWSCCHSPPPSTWKGLGNATSMPAPHAHACGPQDGRKVGGECEKRVKTQVGTDGRQSIGWGRAGTGQEWEHSAALTLCGMWTPPAPPPTGAISGLSVLSYGLLFCPVTALCAVTLRGWFWCSRGS